MLLLMTSVSVIARVAVFALVAALSGTVARPAAPAPLSARTTCWAGYSYDGAQSPVQAYGVGAVLTLDRPPDVYSGHVAAWVGVGGAGMGPGGADEWLQAGIAHDAGGGDVVYYEYKRPGDAEATYVPVEDAQPGVFYSVMVYERAAQRNAWRVMVDGVKVSDPILLPGSHGAFAPVATAESWDGGVAGSCNRYAFDFANLAVRTQFGGAWQPFDLSRVLRDPAYGIDLRSSGFTAYSR
jgi:hypothetical protein